MKSLKWRQPSWVQNFALVRTIPLHVLSKTVLAPSLVLRRVCSKVFLELSVHHGRLRFVQVFGLCNHRLILFHVPLVHKPSSKDSCVVPSLGPDRIRMISLNLSGGLRVELRLCRRHSYHTCIKPFTPTTYRWLNKLCESAQ